MTKIGALLQWITLYNYVLDTERVQPNSLYRSKSLTVRVSVESAIRERGTVVETLRAVGATEMLKTMKVTGLLQLLNDGNHTVFAPTNEAFTRFVPQAVRYVKLELA